MDEGKVKVTFRRKNALSMPNVVLHIHVDHEFAGKITPNGVVYFETAPGEHEIEVFVFRGIRATGTFNLSEGSTVMINTKLGKISLSVTDP